MRMNELPPIVFWILLGLYVSRASRGMGIGTLYYPGPGLMPFYLGIGLVLIAVYMLFRLFLKKSREEEKTAPPWRRIAYVRIAIVVTALIIYSFVIEQVGYIVATLILMAVLFGTAGTKKTYAVIASLVTVLVTYFGFTYLGMRFPPGILAVLGF
jgi:putative tricarboxylic transport membrane protein